MNQSIYQLLFLFLLTFVFLVLPESSSFALDMQAIKEVIRVDRELLQNLDVEIVQHRYNEAKPVYQERWIISGVKFRHEWYQNLHVSKDRAVEIHSVNTSDGRVQAETHYHKKQGTIRRALPQTKHSPVMAPWRLFGVAGAGLGDPVSWLEQEGTTIRSLSGGLVQVEIPGKASPLPFHFSVDYKPYERRIVIFDMSRGGVILSLEDRDKADTVVLHLENLDIACSEGGAWYPQKTILRKYVGNQLIKQDTRRITSLRHTFEADDERNFRIRFPNGFLVRDRVAGISYVAGAVNTYLPGLMLQLIENDNILVTESVKSSKQISPSPNERKAVPQEYTVEATGNSQKMLMGQPQENKNTGHRDKNGGNWALYVAVIISTTILLSLAFWKKLFGVKNIISKGYMNHEK